MPPLTVRVSEALYAAIHAKSKNISATVCSLLAKELGVEYTPPKRGGRRVPKHLTPEEMENLPKRSSDVLAK